MTARFPALDRLTRDPLDPNKILEVAQYFSAAAEWGVAYHLLERAAEIAHHPEILRHLGLVLLQLTTYVGDEAYIQAAEQTLLRGLELQPDSPGLQRALAACAIVQGRVDDAEQLATMSLAAEPDRHDAQHTLALCAFYRQRWGEGWDLYDQHIDKPPLLRKMPREPQAPYWDGTPSQRLLVVGEQGLGEEISFASMVEDAARNNEVTLWCDPRLESLFRRSMPYATVEGARQTDPNLLRFSPSIIGQYDARCLAGTLGRYYRRTAENFPRRGFLTVSDELRAQARAHLAQLPGRKVGIAWTGGTVPSFWHRRFLSLDDLKALTTTPDVTWVSLQYAAPDPATLEACGIHHFPAWTQTQNYEDTAALVMELDAVVTVPTAMAHLCGALGRRAHVLVNDKPRWFYGLEGSEHPWYSSLVLHRQRAGAWPIEEVRAALTADLAGHRQGGC